LSDDNQRTFREVQAFFRLPSIALVEKDLFVVRAIAALAAIDASPFQLVFGGGTALARAHKIVQRMSEDVDFKVVPLAAAPVSRSGIRRQLGQLHKRVTEAFKGAGFAFDPSDKSASWSMDSNRYAVWQLPYTSDDGAGEGLRPTIKVELNNTSMRRPTIVLPVNSFVSESTNQPPEALAVPCVSTVETAAEKLVSITRRTAMELAGAGCDPDTTLVRHLYDLHMLRTLIDPAEVATLARAIAETDGEEFRNQHPAYANDPVAETRLALEALHTDPTHQQRYNDFISAMVYGEKIEFASALATVTELAERMMREVGAKSVVEGARSTR
jgi:hypothetical protein